MGIVRRDLGMGKRCGVYEGRRGIKFDIKTLGWTGRASLMKSYDYKETVLVDR